VLYPNYSRRLNNEKYGLYEDQFIFFFGLKTHNIQALLSVVIQPLWIFILSDLFWRKRVIIELLPQHGHITKVKNPDKTSTFMKENIQNPNKYCLIG